MMEGRSTRLKERVARLFRASSLLRSTCTPSATATATATRSLAADIADEPVFVLDTRRRFHLDRSLSFPFSKEAPTHARRRSVDCGGCRPSRSSEQKARKKKERRVRENGGFYETGEAEGRVCPPATPSSPSKSLSYHYCFNGDDGTKKKKKKRSTKKLLSNGYGFSSSSSVESGDDELGLFSSDEKEEAETETLFSSKSFSSDSSEFYQRPSSKKKKKKKSSKSSSFRRPPPRRDGFQPLVSLSERKKDPAAAAAEEERGVAVVKRSRDPYGDFRSSMVEMIVERQTFGAAELERLLQSYLALNSRHHHPAILRAFSDVWEALFTN